MSTTIRSMSMPRDCEHCVLCDYEQANCLVANDRNTLPHISNERPDWCPLVEVPTPHGRLGDLDKLEQMFVDIDNAPYSGFDGSEPFYSAEDAAQIIRLSPTIIPADEPKEEEKC